MYKNTTDDARDEVMWWPKYQQEMLGGKAIVPTIADYKKRIDKKRAEIQRMIAEMQEMCPHDEIICSSGGDAGDGDKHYSATCTQCWKHTGYNAGYDYGRSKLSEKEEANKQEYHKMCSGKVYVGQVQRGTLYRKPDGH